LRTGLKWKSKNEKDFDLPSDDGLQKTRLSELHSNSGGGLLPCTKGFSKNDIQFILFLWAKQFLDWRANQSSAIYF
jgi:hypothetical protein